MPFRRAAVTRLPLRGAGPRGMEAAALVVAAPVFWVLAGNAGFLRAALQDREPADPGTWAFAAVLVAMLVALHALLLVCWPRRLLKPVVAVMTVATAAAAWFGTRYGVVMDPGMLRNVLRTDAAEATELLSWPLLLHLALYAGLPLLLLWRLRLRPQGWRRALLQRGAVGAAALAVLAGGVLALYQPLASLTRNDHGLRYRIVPAALAWSAGAVLAADAGAATRAKSPIGVDARPGPSWAGATRPRVVVLVVGETARAASWQLAGYPRETTPRLATLPVADLGAVAACGTSTETSLPCLFAPVGRRDYDESRIRGQESLLHVLARAGVAVHWRDNQSGCKGVCDGLPGDRVDARLAPGLCDGQRCLDEGLIADIDARLARARGTQLWVLHMLGNHGPSYFRRYPATFEHFRPACRQDDLRLCSEDEVRNAYDNALRYTDHVLAATIARLAAAGDRVDSALLYVSDHGESLGEYGLYLHGVPYAVAPAVQREVPMLLWTSRGYESVVGLAKGCLRPALARERAAGRVAHDHVFHTLLGLLDVRTALHEPALDLTAPCRPDGTTAVAQR